MSVLLFFDVLVLVLLVVFPWGFSRSAFLPPKDAFESEGINPERLIQRFVAEMKSGASLQRTFTHQLNLDVNALERPKILHQLQRRFAKESPQMVQLLTNCLDISYRLSSQLGTNTQRLFKTILQRIELFRSGDFAKVRALSGPKASAKVLACLPLFGVFMGFLFGQNLFQIYFDLGFGTVIFILGIGFWVLGRVMTNRAIEKSFPKKDSESSFDIIFTLQAVNVCVQAGFSVVRSLEAVGNCLRSSEGEAILRTVRGLKRGIDWDEAWGNDCPELEPLREILEPSYRKGRALGDQIDSYIQKYRLEAESEIAQKGEKLAVKTLIPVGLCYLPSFIVLGLIPLMIALAHFG